MTRMMCDLVEVQGSFKPSVQLPGDFFDEELNRHFVESYIPTPEILEIFMKLRNSLQPNSEHRARVFASTFGTGKSDLMLMIANYVTRSPDDPLLKPFFTRLERLDHAKAEAIYQARKDKAPFLLVLLQADTVSTFSSFVLNGLSEALAQAGHRELLGTTYYQAALDLIESWENLFPVNITRLGETLEREHGQTLTQLKEDLRGAHADLALDTFQQVVRGAIGVEFQPNTVIKMPYQAFDEVAKGLVASGQYSGIFVIADEFTHLLEKLAESSTAGDSKAIDNLAEAASRSASNQLHFYVISLYAFASMPGSTQLAQAALERIGGRFKQHELRSQNAEELISASISKRVSAAHLFDEAPGQEDELLTVAMRLWASGNKQREREWLRETVVRGCFPLHPLATYCLRPLNAVLAQNERTMFSFIWDQEHGLNCFIQTTKAFNSTGNLNLLSLEGLFDYFNVSIKEKRPDLWQVYLEGARLLSPEQLEKGLEGQLLRALILLEVTSGDPSLRADSDLLRHALALPPSSLPEIMTALEQLQEHGIAYPSQSGDYQLVKPGRANPLELRRLIERRARELRGSPLDQLNRDLREQPKNVEAQRYNSLCGTARKLLARFVSSAELSSPASLSLGTLEQDGLLCYVVAASDQELAQARSTALRLTEQYNRLVIAVPRRPTDLVMRWKLRQALEELRKDANYRTSDYQDLLVDSGLVGKDYLDAFKAERKYFDNPRDLEWYRAGRFLPLTKDADLRNLASTVMEDVFPATPAHNTAQHLTATRKTKTLQDALDHILQAPFKLKTKGQAAVKALLLDGAGELGLIYRSGSEGGYDIYDLGVPDRTLSKAVWDLIGDELRQANPLGEIISKLLKPPYGLYRPVLQLFLAVFYRVNRDYMELYSATEGFNRPLDITSKEIIELVENPSQYVIRYQPLTELEHQFWRGLAERVLYPSHSFQQAQAGGVLRNRVAKLVRQWITDKLLPLARNASLEELATVLSVPQEILLAGRGLIEVANLSTEAQSAAALLDTLPTHLELATDRSRWTNAGVEQAVVRLESACQQLEGFSTTFKAQLAWQIGQRFGLTTAPSNWNESLKAAQEWREQFAERVPVSEFASSSDAYHLLSLLDDKPHSFEQLFLNTLPERWQFGVFEKWQEIGIRDKYLARLEQAKAVVEAKAVELGTRPPKEEPKAPPAPPTADKTASSAPSLLSKLTVTGKSASKRPGYTIETPVTVIADPSLASDKASPVEQALAEIKALISRLSSAERETLWALLRKEYDPQ